MNSKWKQWLVVLIAGIVTACTRGATKPDRPSDPPTVVEVPVEVYVPIERSLLERCKWLDNAPLEQMPSVARGRKGCLQFYEANIDAIGKVQGKPVPKPAIKPKK